MDPQSYIAVRRWPKRRYAAHDCIYVFYMDLNINSYYFPIQYLLLSLHNPSAVFTARYGLDLCAIQVSSSF